MTAIQMLTILAAVIASAVGSAAWRRHDDLKAIDRALYHEIVSMRFQAEVLAAEITRRHNDSLPLDAAFFSAWRLSAPLIYPAIGGRLGQLKPRFALDRVGYFHAQLADARARVAEVNSSGGIMASPYRLLSNLMRACNHVGLWVDFHHPTFGSCLCGSIDLTPAHGLLEKLEGAEEDVKVWPYCWADTCFRYPPGDEGHTQ